MLRGWLVNSKGGSNSEPPLILLIFFLLSCFLTGEVTPLAGSGFGPSRWGHGVGALPLQEANQCWDLLTTPAGCGAACRPFQRVEVCSVCMC